MDRLAEIFRTSGMEDLHVARIEPQDVADHQPRTAPLGGGHDPARCLGGVGQRLFQQDRLARLRRGDGCFLVQAIGQGRC